MSISAKPDRRLASDIRGQAMTELVLVLLLSIGPVFGATSLFHTEWSRIRCAHQVFERTHSALAADASASFPNSGVRISRGEDRIRGEGFCEGIRETVELPRLEAARWSD